MNTELTLMSIITLITLAASGGALYVSMKVSGSLANFKNDLLKDLDERYVRQREYGQMETMRKELESTYRQATQGQIQGIQVEVRRDRDDLTIALKGLLSAVNMMRDEAPRRGVKGES